MNKVPYCKNGHRRCSVSKKCMKFSKNSSTKKCKVGSRKCANKFCYKKRKSVKSRKQFEKKYLL